MSDETFEIPFTERPTGGGRAMINGKYAATITSVKKKIVPSGRLQGTAGIDWGMTVLHGPLRGTKFIVNTLLGAELGWTTNSLMAALFPSIKPGQTVQPGACIGLKIEIMVEVRPGKDGRTSQYVNSRGYYPYVEDNYAGDSDSAFDNHLKSGLNNSDLKSESDEIPF